MRVASAEELLAVAPGVGGDAAHLALVEEMVLVAKRGDVGQMDPGDHEDAAAVEGRQGDGHDLADRREDDGGVEGHRGRGVGRAHRGRPELEGQPAGVLGAGHHVDLGALVHRHLGGQVGGSAEPVDARGGPRGEGPVRRRERYPMMPAHSSGAAWSSDRPSGIR